MIYGKWHDDTKKFLHNGIKATIITKENFKRDYATLSRHDAIIIDEAHYFFGVTSAMHKSLTKYIKLHDPEIVVPATATPYLSTPMNVYAACLIVGQPINYRYFQQTFFYPVKMGAKTIWKKNESKLAEQKLAEIIKTIGDVVDMEEVLGYDGIELPEQRFDTVYLDMTEEQQKAHDEVFEVQFINEWTKKHQVENGYLSEETLNDEYDIVKEYRHFDSNKNNFIVNKARELLPQGQKIAIFCRYKLQITVLSTLLMTEFPSYPQFILTGDTQNKYDVIQSIEKEDACIVIIQSACSAGYELPSVNHIIFASLSFSFVDYQQALGRFLRMNKPTENFYTHLVIKGGVDEDVYKSIMKKQDFSLAIYNK